MFNLNTVNSNFYSIRSVLSNLLMNSSNIKGYNNSLISVNECNANRRCAEKQKQNNNKE